LLNAFLLLNRLLQDKVYRPGAGWAHFFVKVFLANQVMILFLLAGQDSMSWSSAEALERVWALAAWIMAGAMVYGLALLALGVRPNSVFSRH
jgi:putative peptidoglycan lipid II flippase